MKSRMYLALTLLLFCLTSYPGNHAFGGIESNRYEGKPFIKTYGVRINVDDMDKAVSFYCGKLGFDVEDRSGYPGRVVLRSGDRNKLILTRVKKLVTRGPADTGFSFTLQVNDLDEAIGRMKSLGVELGESNRRKEGVGSAIYIRDPFGRLISLMHQTIVKVEPFKEPKIYNFGFLIPNMETGRDFYSDRLGFVVRSEKYLPLDLPLGHTDKSFAFMLHYRPGVKAIKSEYPGVSPFNMLIFETDDLEAAVNEMKRRGIKFIDDKPREDAQGSYIAFEDPFGNVSELLELTK
jgi:catechol 2,3-dioxygenase-like lactoylglutathione lyase family enzyme